MGDGTGAIPGWSTGTVSAGQEVNGTLNLGSAMG